MLLQSSNTIQNAMLRVIMTLRNLTVSILRLAEKYFPSDV